MEQGSKRAMLRNRNTDNKDAQAGRTEPPTSAGVSRRRMLGQMAGGLAGAGLAFPLAAEAAAVGRGSRARAADLDPAAPAGAAAQKSQGAWQPKFLDDHQVATLIAMGEHIAPGAKSAKAHEFIDLLLSVIPAEAEQHFSTGNSVPVGTVSVGPRARQRLLDALGAFDAAARRQHRRPFKQLTAAQQEALLTAAESAPEDSLSYRHYLAARNWILGAFYTTEPGIKTLGWNGRLYFPDYPNCAAV